MASPSQDMKYVWFLVEGWGNSSVTIHLVSNPGPSALRLLLHVCGACPALLSFIPFLPYSAACVDLVLHTALASLRLQCSHGLCERAQSQLA